MPHTLCAGTFHSVAARMLRGHIHRLQSCGRAAGFSINDQDDGVSLLMSWVTEQVKATMARNGERPDTKPVGC